MRGTVVLADPDYSIVHGIFSAGQLGKMALIHKRGDRSGSAGERVYPGKMTVEQDDSLVGSIYDLSHAVDWP